MAEEPVVYADSYDLDVKEVIKTIGGVRYTLREASGAAACAYQNIVMSSTLFSPEGKPKGVVSGIADAELVLLAACMYKTDDPTQTPLPLSVVKGWPSRVTTPLAAEAKLLSGLEVSAKKDADKTKNGQGSTTDGSD